MRRTSVPPLGVMAALLAPAAVRRLVPGEVNWPLVVGRTADGRPYRSLAALVNTPGDPPSFVVVPVDEHGTVEASVIERALASERSRGDAPAPVIVLPSPRGTLPLTVVITTCRDALAAVRCVGSFLSDDDDIEVVVVENRPAGSTVRSTMAECFPGDGRVRVVDEPRPGLSRARNLGLREAGGDVIAFLDDDVICDPWWLSAVRAAHAGGTLVTGPILPYSLDSVTQVAFEQFASFSKGLRPATFRLDAPPEGDRFFPYSFGAFGSGANLTFGSNMLRDLGGFDETLGAGTETKGGEDTDILLRALRLGASVSYDPRAIVWHEHPVGWRLLYRKSFSHGIALGAFLTKLATSPSDRMALLRRAPYGVSHFLSSNSRKNAGKGETYPRRLDALERVGMLVGPVAYAVSAARMARERRE